MARMEEERTSGNRVSVYEAAEVMGVTVDAIRKRISRRTIPHERDEDGRVWVLLDADQDRPVMYMTPTSRHLITPRSYPRCAAVSRTSAASSQPSARATPKQGACSWQRSSAYRRP
jgi:hypothetical protein